MTPGARGRYRIVATPSAQRGLAELPPALLRSIATRLYELAEGTGSRRAEAISLRDDLYRIRAGDLRIIYRIDDVRRLYVVEAIGHPADLGG